MGSFSMISGTVFVTSCPEVDRIVEDLHDLAQGMDERTVICEPADAERYGHGVLCVDICISGHASAATSTRLGEEIQKLGPHAVEAARLHTEWEGSSGCLYVGNAAQVAQAESADALDRIRNAVPMLRGKDVSEALHLVLRRPAMPPIKARYFETSAEACPFCGSKDLRSGPLEAEGLTGWAGVTCSKCGRSWQDIWTVIDMTTFRDADGREICINDQKGDETS